MPFKALAAKLVPKVASKALPVASKLTGGVVKAAGGPLGSILQRAKPSMPGAGATRGPGGGPIVSGKVTRGGESTAQAVQAARAMGGAGAIVVGNVLKGVVDQAGRWWTNSKIASLVRRVGPEAAAIALGVAVTQIYQAVTENHAKGQRRRRKGLSYRDITTTRRTLTRLDRLACLARKPMTTRKKSCR